MKKIFAEIGFGNGTFFSTEIEEGDGDGSGLARLRREYRVPKFVRPQKIDDYYLRVWIFKWVFILSIKDGFRTTRKDRYKIKVLFGIGGESEQVG